MGWDYFPTIPYLDFFHSTKRIAIPRYIKFGKCCVETDLDDVSSVVFLVVAMH